MFGISIFSLVVSFLVFNLVNLIIAQFSPTNAFFARLLVLLIGTAIVSVIFAVRQFRYLGRSKWKSNVFHKTLMRTFVVNFLILFAIQMMPTVF